MKESSKTNTVLSAVNAVIRIVERSVAMIREAGMPITDALNLD